MREPAVQLSEPLDGKRVTAATDAALCTVYLIGIYLGVGLSLPGGVPAPCIVAGAAGGLLAVRHAADLHVGALAALISLLLVAFSSILAAGDFPLLGERFKGVLQLSYSIVAGLGFFMAARNVPRHSLSRIFLALTLAVLAGAMLETTVPAVKAASDAFRAAVFDSGVYAADRRDIALYGLVRPKVLTSEPSFVAFGYTLFAFGWYVLSRMPGKALVFVGLLGTGYLFVRGPAILMGVAVVPLYEVLLASRRGGSERRAISGSQALIACVVAGAVAVVGAILGWEVLSTRIESMLAGRDPSAFARLIAPAIMAWETILDHPVAGVGLTGWEALDGRVAQLYATSEFLALDVQFDGAAHSLTNYFWSLWIFMGLVFGAAMAAAMTGMLRAVGVPSLLFCWGVWILFGQAAGGFVGPRTWAVFFVVAVVSILHEKADAARFDREARMHRLRRIEPYMEIS